MKLLLILLSILVVYTELQDTCYDESIQACNSPTLDDLINCNSKFPSFIKNVGLLQRYANNQIEKNFEYLLLRANFGSYNKNRPGFVKQFHGLSDKSWNNGIELIKYIAKRGGVHGFRSYSKSYYGKQTYDLNEINSSALALDYEKSLAVEAHRIHEIHSRANRPSEYDPEVAHFIEEEFVEGQATAIRRLSGYISDLTKLFKDTDDISMSLYFYDEYLNKLQ